MSWDLSELSMANKKNLDLHLVSNTLQMLGFCLAGGLTVVKPNVSSVLSSCDLVIHSEQ